MNIISKLTKNNGYYLWTPLGEGSESVWLHRAPRTDLPDQWLEAESDEWLEAESDELIHICNPDGLQRAMEEKDITGVATWTSPPDVGWRVVGCLWLIGAGWEAFKGER